MTITKIDLWVENEFKGHCFYKTSSKVDGHSVVTVMSVLIAILLFRTTKKKQFVQQGIMLLLF